MNHLGGQGVEVDCRGRVRLYRTTAGRGQVMDFLERLKSPYDYCA
jgi:hypothetical protein